MRLGIGPRLPVLVMPMPVVVLVQQVAERRRQVLINAYRMREHGAGITTRSDRLQVGARNLEGLDGAMVESGINRHAATQSIWLFVQSRGGTFK